MPLASSAQISTTVFRDPHGRRLDPAEEKLRRLEERKKQEAEDERHASWGGIATSQHSQQLVAQRRRKALESERGKPFIRYASDQRLNSELKRDIRWDDPARHFMAGLKEEGGDRVGTRGPPNRFNIAAGKSWDGIDRSNGFENILFQKRASEKSLKERAHRFTVEDL